MSQEEGGPWKQKSQLGGPGTPLCWWPSPLPTWKVWLPFQGSLGASLQRRARTPLLPVQTRWRGQGTTIVDKGVIVTTSLGIRVWWTGPKRRVWTEQDQREIPTLTWATTLNIKCVLYTQCLKNRERRMLPALRALERALWRLWGFNWDWEWRGFRPQERRAEGKGQKGKHNKDSEPWAREYLWQVGTSSWLS